MLLDYTARHILRRAAERSKPHSGALVPAVYLAGSGGWDPGRPIYDRTRGSPRSPSEIPPFALGRRVIGATQPRLRGMRP